MAEEFTKKIFEKDDKVTRLTFYVQNHLPIYSQVSWPKIAKAWEGTDIEAHGIDISKKDPVIIAKDFELAKLHTHDGSAGMNRGVMHQETRFYKATISLISKNEISQSVMNKIDDAIVDVYKDGLLNGLDKEKRVKIEKFGANEVSTGRLF